MYAVIETGGKQYRVEPGDVIDIERTALSEGKRRGKKKEGGEKTLEFERVLLVAGDEGLQVGGPLVEGARVRGVVVEEIRGRKLLVFKKKRRKQYKRLRGHRQELLRVRIEGIEV